MIIVSNRRNTFSNPSRYCIVGVFYQEISASLAVALPIIAKGLSTDISTGLFKQIIATGT